MTAYERRQCEDGHVAVSPMPSAAELGRFYSEAYYQQAASATYQTQYSNDDIAHKRLRARSLLYAATEARSQPPITVLDVGTGEGFLMAVAADAGGRVTGMEYSGYAVEKFNPAVRDRLRVGEIDTLLTEARAAGERYDLCVLQNVLEHVVDPVATLRSVTPLLAPGGLLGIAVPNDFSDLQALLTERGIVETEYWWAPPQHLHYFNTDNIGELLRQAGLAPVDSYCEFPIEFFLLHPGSNYVTDRSRGKPAHHARVTLDLHLARKGLPAYLAWSRALFECGVGRDITVLARLDASRRDR